MRIWDLHTPVARIHQAVKDLQAAKIRIESQWQDAKLQEFERTFFEPLEPQLRGTVTAITELADTLRKAENAVGDY